MPESDLRLFSAALPQQFQNFRVKAFQFVPAPAALRAGVAAFAPLPPQSADDLQILGVFRANPPGQFVAQFPGQRRALAAGGYGDRQAAALQAGRQREIAQCRCIGDIHQCAGRSGFLRRLFVDRRGIGRAEDQPVTGRIPTAKNPRQMTQFPLFHPRRQLRRQLRANDRDFGAGGQQRFRLAFGHRPAADHQTAPAAQIQIHRIIRRWRDSDVRRHDPGRSAPAPVLRGSHPP